MNIQQIATTGTKMRLCLSMALEELAICKPHLQKKHLDFRTKVFTIVHNLDGNDGTLGEFYNMADFIDEYVDELSNEPIEKFAILAGAAAYYFQFYMPHLLECTIKVKVIPVKTEQERNRIMQIEKNSFYNFLQMLLQKSKKTKEESMKVVSFINSNLEISCSK